MKKNIHIVSTIAIAVLLSSCTRYYINQGDSLYNAFAYKKATTYYEKAVAKKKKTATLEKLADCYFKINDYKNAEKYFKDACFDKNTSIATKTHYGQTLMSLGKYEDAKSMFNQVLNEQPDNQLAKAFLEACNSQPIFVKDSARYVLTPVDIKGFEAYFSPVVYKEGIVFAGEQTETQRKKIYSGTMRGYQHLYYSKKDAQGKFAEPVLLNGTVNKHFHSSTASFGNGLSEIYYSSISNDKIKMSDMYDRTYNLAIHHDTIIDNEWKKGKDFPHNNADYSNAHPCLSADSKTMFLVSDMPGGFGGSDLYVSTLSNGEWSVPKNLGPSINTSGNETYPVIGPDGKFYFSSNGLKGIGGLDVFVADLDGISVSNPRNLNYPLNSKADDFGILWNVDMKTGYVSSNRLLNDRIFSFVRNPFDAFAEGVVTDKENNKPIAGATVIFRNMTSNAIDSVITDSDGKYSFKMFADCDYVFEVRKSGFFTVTKDAIDTKNLNENKTFTNDFVLQEIIVERPITLDGEKIFFDLDKWNIRKDALPEMDKLLKILTDNPTLVIELSAHTDSRADDKYNQKLSDKRAKATFDYLVKKGIHKRRLVAKGYGETKLVNPCANGIICTDAEHQQNRRTEFMVMKDVFDPVKAAEEDAASKKSKKKRK